VGVGVGDVAGDAEVVLQILEQTRKRIRVSRFRREKSLTSGPSLTTINTGRENRCVFFVSCSRDKAEKKSLKNQFFEMKTLLRENGPTTFLLA
jgi:hypothetical protein